MVEKTLIGDGSIGDGYGCGYSDYCYEWGGGWEKFNFDKGDGYFAFHGWGYNDGYGGKPLALGDGTGNPRGQVNIDYGCVGDNIW